SHTATSRCCAGHQREEPGNEAGTPVPRSAACVRHVHGHRSLASAWSSAKERCDRLLRKRGLRPKLELIQDLHEPRSGGRELIRNTARIDRERTASEQAAPLEAIQTLAQHLRRDTRKEC